jgi:hypothetical protein
MQSRLMKGITLAVITLALPVVAFAQTSRIAGLGTQGDYMKDYTNIFTYPSCITQVGNLVYGEFGIVTDYDNNYSEYFSTEDRSVGAVLGNLWDGKYGTWGFNMREYSPALGTNFQPYAAYDGYLDEYLFGTGFETFAQYLDPNVPGDVGYTPYWNGYGTEAFDLMWGKKINNMNVGLRLNRSNFKHEDKNPSYTQEGYATDDRNIMGFGGGLGFDLNPNASAEVSALYQSRTFSFSNQWDPVADAYTAKLESDGGGAYLVSGRIMWKWKPNVLVVPVARYYSFNLGTKYTSTAGVATTYEEKLSGWQLGVAGNWTLNQNDLFVCGVTFAQNTDDATTNKYKATESLMPTMFASLETHVNPWLTIRFGGRKGVFYSQKYTDGNYTPAFEHKESMSPFQFFTGAGVKLGTLQFDATMAQDFFHNPASYLTNSNNNYVPLFPKVTATYSF